MAEYTIREVVRDTGLSRSTVRRLLDNGMAEDNGSGLPAKREETGPAEKEFVGLHGTIVPNGLVYGEDVSYEEWESDGQMLLFMLSWTPWGLADWLAYGERKWGQTYTQASKITGKAIKTLYNIKYLGTQFPKEEGLRSAVLDPAHHDVLSGFTPEEKRHWLKVGEKLDKESNGHLTVKHFREVVRDGRRELPGSKTEKAPPPKKCGECFGSGKCSHCHGSGEETPVDGNIG